MSQRDRFAALQPFAVPDHKLMPGVQREIDSLPRKERRRRAAIIAPALNKIHALMTADMASGAGFHVDQQIREFALEYNDRQLGHGLLTMPFSFNVMEAFFEYRRIEPSGVFLTRPERDHLFPLADFLEWATSPACDLSDLSHLAALPEGVIHNYTAVGDVRDLAFLDASSRSYVLSGVSFVRLGPELHLLSVGGTVADLAEETARIRAVGDDMLFGSRPPEKASIKPAESLERRAEPLAGTDDVWKSTVMATVDVATGRFLTRQASHDHGDHYETVTDDPDCAEWTRDPEKFLAGQAARLGGEYAVHLEVASTLLQLPRYFDYRISLVREGRRDTAIASLRGGELVAASRAPADRRVSVRKVASLEIVETASSVLRSYSPPRFKVEVEGFWRRLPPGSAGRDRDGNPVEGRTWVKRHMRWRDRPERERVLLVKSSVSAAEARAAAILASDPTARLVAGEVREVPSEKPAADASAAPTGAGWVYVMRCPLMEADVYKVGWTAKEPRDRAAELSRATGVPMAFVVVEAWRSDRPRVAETAAHAALDTLRVNGRREFFRGSYNAIRKAVEASVRIAERASPSA